MRCTEFQQFLPDMIDGPSQGELAAHLKSCASCSGLLADLQAISQGGKQLNAADEPSPRVWANIQRTLEAEGLIHIARQPGGILVPGKRASPAWVWISLAAMVVVAISLVLSTRRPTDSSELAKDGILIPRIAAPATQLTANARDDQQLLAELSPAVRTAFEDNLKSVNAFIEDAEQSVAQDPNDDEARHFLMDAYRQRELVYQLAIDRSVQ